LYEEQLNAIIVRLERLEDKFDQLVIRYERHEAQAEKTEKLADEFRRFLYTISAGVIVSFLVSVSSFLISMMRTGVQ